VPGLETKEEKGKWLKKAGMIGLLGQVILRTHHEIAFQDTVRSKLHPRRYINDLPRLYREVISDLTEPLRPPFDEDISATLKRPPRQSHNLQTLSRAHKMMHSPRRLRPPDPPAKIPDLSHFYPNDPTLDPRFNAYHRFPSFPPSARTGLPRLAQDISACTADFVAARSRIGHTRPDSRGPSHAN
jgi:hypothetical protein